MSHARHLLPVLLVVLLILSGCGVGSGGSGSTNGLNPTSQLTLEQADQVAETFLQAWEKLDYATMYGLISPNSRDAYHQEAFVREYQDAATKLALSALDARLISSLRQGTTAAILYDVTFTSKLFGTIADPGRTLRLIETPEGWRVAWSRMDIFASLAEGARLELVRNQPGRGNIYDRNGQVLVDQNGRSVLLWVTRRDIADEAQCIALLARILRLEYSDIEARFSLYFPETLFLAGEVDPETYQVEEANLRELCDIGDDATDTSTRNTRRYFSNLAAHLVGYVGRIQPEQLAAYEQRGYPPDALIGQLGIERSYEEELAGQIGARLVIVAPTGETLREIANVPSTPGQSVYLTIDRNLQAAVQTALSEAYSEASPTWGITSPGAAAIVMDVHTGEILAIASYPSFDPGLFNPDSPVADPGAQIAALKSDPRTPLFDRAMRGLYPAGSVFKIVSLAAGLDSGVYNENITTFCAGVWSNPNDGGSPRTDWLLTGHGGGINARRGLAYSCDPYFWDLGTALHTADPELLPRYAQMMGLGVLSGQDELPEEAGYVPTPAEHFRRNAVSWALGDTLNLVIGQGQLQITPLQIVRLVAAIANGGTLYKPLFVSKVQLIGEPPSYVAQPTPVSVLDFDPGVFQVIRDAMCDVTLDPNGTARYIFEEWYRFQGEEVIVCGKTGTAQTGGEGTKPQAWFAAFAPRDDPQIAVVVIVENSCEGSEVAAPIVRRIVEDYYGMPHSVWPPLWRSGCISLGE